MNPESLLQIGRLNHKIIEFIKKLKNMNLKSLIILINTLFIINILLII
jgi:hypothetical protein